MGTAYFRPTRASRPAMPSRYASTGSAARNRARGDCSEWLGGSVPYEQAHNRTECIDVGTLVGAVSTRLLRRHVSGRADNIAFTLGRRREPCDAPVHHEHLAERTHHH